MNGDFRAQSAHSKKTPLSALVVARFMKYPGFASVHICTILLPKPYKWRIIPNNLTERDKIGQQVQTIMDIKMFKVQLWHVPNELAKVRESHHQKFKRHGVLAADLLVKPSGVNFKITNLQNIYPEPGLSTCR